MLWVDDLLKDVYSNHSFKVLLAVEVVMKMSGTNYLSFLLNFLPKTLYSI